MAGPVQALIATLALTGIHYYNFSAVKFAHDQMQLPFWALTGLFFYRALVRGRALDWMLAGAMLALAFWSKYAAFALALSLVVFLLLDPVARRTLRTPGPYLMALGFRDRDRAERDLAGASPVSCRSQYVTDRARVAQPLVPVITYPLHWTLAQAFFIHPALILLGVDAVSATAKAGAAAALRPRSRAATRRCWRSGRSSW